MSKPSNDTAPLLENLVEQAKSGDKDVLEEIIRRIQDKVYGLAIRMLYIPADTNAEIKVFMENPRNLDVVGKARLFASKTLVFEVVEAHGCNSRHKKGDKLRFDGAGNLLTKRSPERICIYALSAATSLIFAAGELLMAGIDPNEMRFKRTGCFDVGVRCGGWGRIVMELKVDPFPMYAQTLVERGDDYDWAVETGLRLERGCDPRDRLPEARSIIVAVYDYFREHFPEQLVNKIGRLYQSRSYIDPEVRTKMANWIHGCDLCQEACPRNQAKLRAELPENAFLEVTARHFSLTGLLMMEREFETKAVAPLLHTYMQDRKYFQRNAAVALGNSGDPEMVPHIAAAMEDPEELVRAHAAWAIGQLGGAEAKRALEASLTRETGSEAAREIRAALTRA